MNQQQILERKQRGYELSQKVRIQKDGEFYLVPSSKTGKYKVSLFHQTCTCPDHETRKVKCKHLYGVEYFVDSQFLSAIDNVPAEVKETPKKKTYPQPNWKAYHQSQVSEKIQFQYLLHQLCQNISTPHPKTGRKRFELSDLVFAMVYKVYSCFSSRRFMSDLHEAFGKEYLIKLPHYNTIINAFSFGEITPILTYLIEMSSLPLASIETDFAVDSTGVSTCRFFQWYQAKYWEDKKLIERRDWVKIHLCCGVKTNIVSAVEISNKFSGDSPYFRPLVDKTALRFKINEVSADKAYSSEKNMQTVLDYGGTPYIAFKANAGLIGSRSGQIWKNMFHYYSLNQERFLNHYHKRSNVETVFMMIKTKFGDALRSKTETAMVNEALCKVLAHNLCVLITSMHELGLKPKFWKELH
jgi:transposase/predicted nucleic acid-binding Zn finger protein